MEIMEAMYTLDLVSQRQQASPLNIDEKDGFLRDEWQRIELVQNHKLHLNYHQYRFILF